MITTKRFPIGLVYMILALSGFVLIAFATQAAYSSMRVNAESNNRDPGIIFSNLFTPQADNQIVTTDADTPVEITLTADGGYLAFAVIDQPSHGTLIGTTPSLTYTPGPNYNGEDSFTFKAFDGVIESEIATVTITINPINDPPVADDQTVTTDEDNPVDITLTASDTDEDSLTFAVITQPSHGTLSGTIPNLIYTPDPDYFGSDGFSFRVRDDTGYSNTAYVTISIEAVNDLPVADDQAVTTYEDDSVNITLTASDIDNSNLYFNIYSNWPHNGTLTGTIPNLTYTPHADYTGADKITFYAYDGIGHSNIATITITINPIDDQPVANYQAVTTDEDTPVDITLTASDTDEDPLTFTVIDQPSHGTLIGKTPDLTYTPDPNYNGEDSFTFNVSDSVLESELATVTITINPINDQPVANDQSVTTDEDNPVDIILTASDTDEDPLTFAVITQPSHGTLSGPIPNLIYTPNAGYAGSDSFSFHVHDGTGYSNNAYVTITITPVNDQPVADGRSVITDEDTFVNITLTASDPDGDHLTFEMVDQPSHGTLSGTIPNLVYTPDPDYFGSDGFSFHVHDDTGYSNTANVTISIEAVNDLPVADDQAVTTGNDAFIDITLSATDADGDDLTFTVVVQPMYGTLSGTEPYLTYTPNPGYAGSDEFSFNVYDGSNNSNTATIAITINAINDQPVADDQLVTTDEDSSVAIILKASDSNEDSLTFTIVNNPRHGMISGMAPNITFIPYSDYSGSDSFSFHVHDGTQYSDTAIVSITVSPINDEPTAKDQSATTDEDVNVDVTLAASDIDTDDLSFSIINGPYHGSLSGTSPNFTYTPDPGYTGSDSFSFNAFDGIDYSDIAIFTVTVAFPMEQIFEVRKNVTDLGVAAWAWELLALVIAILVIFIIAPVVFVVAQR